LADPNQIKFDLAPMNVLRGDLTRTNGLFLLCTTPLLVRIWIEAVVWRLRQGPQMVGFQLLHMAAGYWTVPLLLSLLILWLYELWAAVVGVRALVPAWRHLASGKRFIALGVASVFLFFYVGDLIQSELTPAAIYAGAAAMGALFLLVLWVALRRSAAPARPV
jgi:hypothetical protein